jgi:hypothetical protein
MTQGFESGNGSGVTFEAGLSAIASRLAPTGDLFQRETYVGASLLALALQLSPQHLEMSNMSGLPAAHVLRLAE